MAYTFPQTLRLRTAAEFRQLFHKARKISGNGLAVFVTDNQFAYPRLGIIISKKNVKMAVARNRLKRIVRELFRQKKEELVSVDMAIIFYKGADKLSNEELRNRVVFLWSNLQKC